MNELITAALLGIVEGVTEFLPISSTGHLLLAQHFLKEQTELFNVVIQCGAMLAVIAVFSKRVKEMLTHFNEPATRDYIIKVGVAFGMTCVGMLALKKMGLTLPKTMEPIAWATLIGGVVIFLVERVYKGAARFSVGSFTDMSAFAAKLAQGSDDVSKYLFEKLSAETREALKKHEKGTPLSDSLQSLLVAGLNLIIKNGLIHDAAIFKKIQIREETQNFLEKKPQGDELIRLNRMLLEDAYPQEVIKHRTASPSDITWQIAITVGLAQILAGACPGTSRSGATILFAMMVGLSRPAATEFSFLVGIPTMFAAGVYEIHHELKHAVPGHHEEWAAVAVGTIVSAIVAFIVVKWLLRYVQSHSFTGFAWYRVIVGGFLLIALAKNWLA